MTWSRLFVSRVAEVWRNRDGYEGNAGLENNPDASESDAILTEAEWIEKERGPSSFAHLLFFMKHCLHAASLHVYCSIASST